MKELKITTDNSVKSKHYVGGQWKVRKLQKGLRTSQESGRKKGLVPPAWARYICRHNRSTKHPMYAFWDAKCDGGKVKWVGA